MLKFIIISLAIATSAFALFPTEAHAQDASHCVRFVSGSETEITIGNDCDQVIKVRYCKLPFATIESGRWRDTCYPRGGRLNGGWIEPHQSIHHENLGRDFSTTVWIHITACFQPDSRPVGLIIKDPKAFAHEGICVGEPPTPMDP